MNSKSKIILVAYLVLMVAVTIVFNNGGTHHPAGEAEQHHAETATPEADSHNGKEVTAAENESLPAEDPMAHKKAVEPENVSTKKDSKQAMLAQTPEKPVKIDHTTKEPADEKNPFANKPSPNVAIDMLKQGNERFVNGKSEHPHLDAARLKLAAIEDQGDHAYATVITCSDSRVPVEAIFDAGIMDIFVIRVAGNVCDVDERGSIEYGLAHVNTPVLVVLGHTQCGAVTAVTKAIQGHGHPLERNIPALVANIAPAVKRAMIAHPELKGEAVIPAAIEENVWTGIQELFMESPATRDLVKKGAVKVVGAIYDVGTGKVNWLPEQKTLDILAAVETCPAKAVEAMAGVKKASKCPALTNQCPGRVKGHCNAAGHPKKPCDKQKHCKKPCKKETPGKCPKAAEGAATRHPVETPKTDHT